MIPEEKPLLRCAKCRSFANPFYRFIDKGDTFICNICGAKADTPKGFFNESELKNKKKTEMNFLSYDIVVGSE